MMLSAWFAIAWFFSRGADAMRPSALHRMYVLIWLYAGSFVLLALVTVLTNDYQIAGGYFIMFYFAGVFFALVFSYLELFFAPSKTAYARYLDQSDHSRPNSGTADQTATASNRVARPEDRPSMDDDASETTSLLRGDRRGFAKYGSRQNSVTDVDGAQEEAPQPLSLKEPYLGEQEWSGHLPSWIWILQLLFVAPIVLVLVGQIALLLTSALYQTPSDGNSSLFIYLSFAILTALVLAPIGPFIHRFTYHVPMFLFLVCVGTVIYNLVAFPFSRDHRLKVYFVQQVDCATGINTVSLTGLDGYVQQIVAQLPSAQGKGLNCTTPDVATRKELKTCSWQGLPARVVPKAMPFSNKTYTDTWLDYTITTGSKSNVATIQVAGKNTRACRILFDSPVSELAVAGAVSDPRFNAVGEHGSRELRLWHREWSKPWSVSVAWNTKDHSKLSGKIVCLWSDANAGEIPAFDEVQHYLPVWAIPSKISDGLVEGFKRFST
jgi:hypothetical protein